MKGGSPSGKFVRSIQFSPEAFRRVNLLRLAKQPAFHSTCDHQRLAGDVARLERPANSF